MRTRRSTTTRHKWREGERRRSTIRNIENYGEISAATATAEKIEENIRAMPQKMKITAKNGLKIEKMGSTSPKPRFLGHFYGFRGLQA
jgi:ABC-type enterochelin transport system substrate-binding protein